MINVVPRTFNNFPRGRYMFLDKFDIFVFRHRASQRAQRWCKIDVHDRESRYRADEHTCKSSRVFSVRAAMTMCASAYSRRSSVLTSLSLSLCPVPFLSHIHDVIATPTTVTRSHFDPRRSISVFHSLFLCFPSSLAFAPFSFHSSHLHSCLLCRRKNRESGRGRYTPVPIHTILLSRPPLRGSAAHTWIGVYVRKDYEKVREREEEKRRVCVKKVEKRRGRRSETIFQQWRRKIESLLKGARQRGYVHEREKLEDKVDSVVYIHIRKLWSEANGWSTIRRAVSWHTGEKVRQINGVSTITYSKIRRDDKEEKESSELRNSKG